MSQETPLVILRVFEDPGIEFFRLGENDLMVLEQGNDTPEALYLNCHGKIYDLVGHGAGFLAVTFNHRGEREINRHGLLAIQCIHILKETTGRSRTCLQYAAKYWTRPRATWMVTYWKSYDGLGCVRQNLKHRLHLPTQL